jgi:hypothetical protein
MFLTAFGKNPICSFPIREKDMEKIRLSILYRVVLRLIETFDIDYIFSPR